MGGDDEIDPWFGEAALINTFDFVNVFKRTRRKFGRKDGFFRDETLEFRTAELLRWCFLAGLPEKDDGDNSRHNRHRQNAF